MTSRPLNLSVLLILSGTVYISMANANIVTTPNTGTALTLSNSYTAATPTVVTAANATENDLSGNAAGSYTYADGWSTSQTPITADGVAGSPYGFYDSFVFKILGSSVDSITSTINLTSGGSSTHLENLNAQLFALGSQSLPAFAPTGIVSDNPTVSNFNLNANVSGSTVVLAPMQPLAAGTYVLEVQGLVNGNAGGSYVGDLDITPVPLPASLWFLVSGLGVFGLRRTRRVA